MDFKKFSFYSLLILTLFVGSLLANTLMIKAGFIEAKGRIVEWDKDYVVLRFAAEGLDSVTVRTKVSYTKNKNALNQYNLIPVRYNPTKPSAFEIEGVRREPIASIIFLFCFFFVGLVFAGKNLLREGLAQLEEF